MSVWRHNRPIWRYKRPDWRHVVLMLAAWSALAACAPSRSPESGLPAPTTPAPPGPVVPDPSDAPLPLVSTFTYSPGSYRYEVVTESAIRKSSDSAAVEAHVRTTSIVTLRLDSLAGDSLSVQVTLDSVRAERDSVVPEPDSLTPPAPPFSTFIDSRGMPLGSTDLPAGECKMGEGGELLAVARDLLVQVPPELRVGDMWSDTSTVAICRGGVPVTTGVVRNYEVQGLRRDDDGTPLMRVGQTTVFSLAGTQTTEYGQVIALSGSGESRSELELDLTAGIVRSATREGTSDVAVTYGRATTPFTQRVTRSVRLLVP